MSTPAEALLTDIAVIGMAGRFPGARTVDEFWRNVRDGVESIQEYADADLLAAGVDPELLEDPHYVKAGAPMPDMELFDLCGAARHDPAAKTTPFVLVAEAARRVGRPASRHRDVNKPASNFRRL